MSYPPTLLPPNRVMLERLIEQVIRARFDALPVEVIKDFHDPDRCPLALLPWLAREMSVDVWRDEWSEAQKRAVIKASPEVHRKRGTVQAITLTLDTFGQAYRFIEWWQPEAATIAGYTPTPCTAHVELDGAVIRAGEINMPDLLLALRRAKRLTLHISINVLEQVRASNRVLHVVASHASAPDPPARETLRTGNSTTVIGLHVHAPDVGKIERIRQPQPPPAVIYTHLQ